MQTKFIIGFDFAATLSSPESFCVLFDITRMCHHNREPTVLSRVNCHPSHLNVDPFPPALPVTLAHPLLPPKHGWLGQG